MAAGCQGDIFDFCDDINSRQCYNNTVRHDCCQTCEDNLQKPLVPGKMSFTSDKYYQDHTGGYGTTTDSTTTEDTGCEYGDHVGQCNVDNGRLCYNSDVRQDCCDTCQSYETPYPECRYGDKIKNCNESYCDTYSPNRRADCCYTCGNDVPSSTVTWSSTSNPVTNVTSGSSGVPGWAVPVAASIGGLLVLIIVIVVVILCRRNKKSDHLSPIDDKMYNEYKLSKRAPMAPPRHPSTEKGWVDESHDAEYAYINPDHVEGPQSNDRRTGNDPLPPTPAEYLDLTGARTVDYSYSYGNTRTNDVTQTGQHSDRAPSNKYDKFPGSQAYVNQPEKEEMSDNKL